ncbi:hypothetical protein [Bosea vestrisii]|uniref:Regulatory helix-turn-helix LysR family protein n=1 Tax=Bosea vestrisii TaxID=151416 RepID=A0ABW0H8C6_9HYPH
MTRRSAKGGDASAQPARIDYLDLSLAWHVLREADAAGKGAVRSVAEARGIDATLVTRALDRVETAFGGAPFLVAAMRRTGRLTDAGRLFLEGAPPLLDAWSVLHERMLESRVDASTT